MLHSHLTTLNAVSLILNVFQADGCEASALLAGSGIGPADLGHADARITTQQELQVCA
ncbi:AraC family transcriptional regulator, partial [Pseudomonas sp. SIMBA_059]